MFIGYVPQKDNREIAAHLDEGKPYRASIAGWAGTRKPTISVELLEAVE